MRSGARGHLVRRGDNRRRQQAAALPLVPLRSRAAGAWRRRTGAGVRSAAADCLFPARRPAARHGPSGLGSPGMATWRFSIISSVWSDSGGSIAISTGEIRSRFCPIPTASMSPGAHKKSSRGARPGGAPAQPLNDLGYFRRRGNIVESADGSQGAILHDTLSRAWGGSHGAPAPEGFGGPAAAAEPCQARLREIVRLPDERLRFAAHDRCRQSATAIKRRPASKTPTSSCSTPAISASAPRKKSIRNSARSANSSRSAERAGLETTIVVAGCVAQAEGAEILRRQPAVDLVVGPQNYHRLPQLLRAAARRPGVVDTAFPLEDKFDFLPAPAPEAIRARGVAAFVTVQEGCDKFCSFCVVPYTRGAEISRPVAQSHRGNRASGAGGRARGHADRPERQRLSRRGRGRPHFRSCRARRAVAAIPGILRVRYTTSHPNDMSDALIEAHRDLPRWRPICICRSNRASNRILTAMNRRPSRQRLSRHRRQSPRGAAGHRPFLGFHRRLSRRDATPNFEATLDLVARSRLCVLLRLQIFAEAGHARRRTEEPDRRKHQGRTAGDPAAIAGEPAPGIQSRAPSAPSCRCSSRSRAATPVRSIGRSPYLQSVHADDAERLIGAIAQVEIIGVKPNSLRGRIVAGASVKIE